MVLQSLSGGFAIPKLFPLDVSLQNQSNGLWHCGIHWQRTLWQHCGSWWHRQISPEDGNHHNLRTRPQPQGDEVFGEPCRPSGSGRDEPSTPGKADRGLETFVEDRPNGAGMILAIAL